MFPAILFSPILLNRQADETMAAAMERVRTKYGLPSIAAGAIVNGRIVSMNAVGVRRLGADEKATVDDRYHCGSITKSFTAALFATYVQQGKVGWNTPLPSLFPRLASTMDPAFRKVTPLHLMAHRAGLGGVTWPKDVPGTIVGWNGTPPSPRGEFARVLLAEKPVDPIETRYEYSNAGFILLGAILEERTGSPWEALLTSRILRPLGLKSAGFGAAGTADGGHQPWGHSIQNGKLTPVPPGPGADNPPALGPAGTLHMSVPDLLKWCAFQADEGRDSTLLTPESFRVLHTPPFGGNYTAGLVVLPRDWAGGDALYHNGSNTLNYEIMWIAPRKRFGVVVACNAYTPEVDKALNEIAGLLIGRYCPK